MHFLSLPGFLATLPDMFRHAARWSATPATGLVLGEALARAAAPGAPAGGYFWALTAVTASAPVSRLPIMWTYVGLNVLSQYICIKGVYQLTPIVDPLSVNVTLTVRKFVSLLVSIYLFNNTFTAAHWIGAVCVFGGALWYGTIPPPPKPAAVSPALASGSLVPAPVKASGGGGDGKSGGGSGGGGIIEGMSSGGAHGGAGVRGDDRIADDDGDNGAGSVAGDEEDASRVSGVAASGAGGQFYHRHKG